METIGIADAHAIAYKAVAEEKELWKRRNINAKDLGSPENFNGIRKTAFNPGFRSTRVLH